MKINKHVEVIANCPSCKTLETLRVNLGHIERTPHFKQEGQKIYHLCGSRLPCRLFNAPRIKMYSKNIEHEKASTTVGMLNLKGISPELEDPSGE